LELLHVQGPVSKNIFLRLKLKKIKTFGLCGRNLSKTDGIRLLTKKWSCKKPIVSKIFSMQKKN